jgi:hypothetical protein
MTDGTFPLATAKVIKEVAAAYNVEVGYLKGQGRQRPATEARLVAYVLLHEECRIGWAQVATAMGRQYGSGGTIAVAARGANVEAVEQLRSRLRPEVEQPALFEP